MIAEVSSISVAQQQLSNQNLINTGFLVGTEPIERSLQFSIFTSQCCLLHNRSLTQAQSNTTQPPWSRSRCLLFFPPFLLSSVHRVLTITLSLLLSDPSSAAALLANQTPRRLSALPCSATQSNLSASIFYSGAFHNSRLPLTVSEKPIYSHCAPLSFLFYSS